jgi:aerotaxis receptor
MKKNYPVTGREVMMEENSTLVSTTDLKGQITYCNPAFVGISGFTEEELIGASHNIVRHPDMPSVAFEDLWTTVKAGNPWRGFVKNRCKNGDHYWVEAFVTPIFQGGQITGYQSVRSKPARHDIEATEKLYDKLNSGKLQKIPSHKGVFDISLKTRIIGAFTMMMVILAGMMGYIYFNTETGLQMLGQVDPSVLGEEGARMMQLATERAVNISNFTIGIGVALLIMTVVTIYLLIRTIITPMLILKEVAMGIASGDLRTLVKVKTSDEIGDIFLSMKLMQARLQTVIERMSNTSSRVTSLAEQFSDSASQTSKAMLEQQNETEQVATAMNEMSATVAEVARNTEEASLAAQQANDEADKGRQIVQSVRSTIDTLATEVEHSSDSIQDLEEKSRNISNIMEVIRGIAEQTNLLALNAAIEAARAGEQGRGFAVVADEVRSLAQRTQEATLEIKDVIEELQQGISSTVTIMGRGREQAANAVDEAVNADTSLGAISQSVGVIFEMNAQIATAATEQEAVAEEMNRNVISISQMTNQTAEDAAMNSENGHDLVRNVEELQQLFSLFQVPKSASSFNFENAKEAHLAWKDRVRKYLDGDKSALTRAQAVSHRHCVLGKWYYSEGKRDCSSIPAFRDIEPPHEELHIIIKEILDLKERGKDEEAEALYQRIEPLSREIVGLIDQVQSSSGKCS